MNRVCLYLRISTDEDHQPTSLGTQRERLERYCQAMEDWHVVHAFDDQASGATLDRPGLKQALGLARERRFDLLLVYRVDRLSRKIRQLAGLAELRQESAGNDSARRGVRREGSWEREHLILAHRRLFRSAALAGDCAEIAAAPAVYAHFKLL